MDALIIKDMSFYSNQRADRDSRWGDLLLDSTPVEAVRRTPLRFMRNILLLYQ